MSVHLGWCSPLPPAQSGIADYSAELLPALAQRCPVTCFVEHPDQVAPALRQHLRVRPLAEVLRATNILPVYHIGNHSAFHAGILRAAMLRPGVAVLHEIVLYDLVERLLLGAGQARGFASWVHTCEPHAGPERIRAVMTGRVDPHHLPLCEAVAYGARATLTFNTWARDELQRRCPGCDVAAVPQHCPSPPANTVDVAELRATYRIPPNAFVIGSFGHLTPAKRLDVALAAFAKLYVDHRECVYLFAGPPSPRVDVPGMAARLGVGQAVRTLGYVPEPVWWDLMACTDLCVSLRGPTQGETSASLLKQLSAGKAVCVSAAGPDAAYPGDAVAHIFQAKDEVEQLYETMRRAVSDASWRRDLGRRAAAYARESHSVDRCADALVAACERAATLPEPQRRFNLEAALKRSGGVVAAMNRWRYRARLVRRVRRRHGWKAAVLGMRERVVAHHYARADHANSH